MEIEFYRKEEDLWKVRKEIVLYEGKFFELIVCLDERVNGEDRVVKEVIML